MRLLGKQFLAIFVGSIFTFGIAGTAFWGLKSLEKVTDNLLQVDVRINALSNSFAREIAKSRRAEKEFFIFPGNIKKQNKYIVKWNASYYQVFSEFFEELNALLEKKGDTEKLAMIAKAKKLMDSNIEEWKVVTDKFKETQSYDSVNKAEYGSFKKKTHEIEDISVKLIKDTFEDVTKSQAELQKKRKFIEQMIVGIFLVSILWGLLAPIILARRMTSVMVKLTKVTDELSRGQIGVALDIKRKDEFGDLAAAIARMQRSMQIMLKKLKTSK